MAKKEHIYNGKVRSIYLTENKNEIIIQNSDNLTANNAQKRGSFEGKGAINTEFCEIIFKYLENCGIKTHFIKKLNKTEILAKKLDMLPYEFVVRNYAAGSFTSRFPNLKEGDKLDSPIIEVFLKDDKLNDPLVVNSSVGKDITEIEEILKKINTNLLNFFDSVGLLLVDFKVEFGKDENNILLADEISPDTCRLWDKVTKQKFDKDVFRYNLGNYENTYKEALGRLKSV